MLWNSNFEYTMTTSPSENEIQPVGHADPNNFGSVYWEASYTLGVENFFEVKATFLLKMLFPLINRVTLFHIEKQHVVIEWKSNRHHLYHHNHHHHMMMIMVIKMMAIYIYIYIYIYAETVSQNAILGLWPSVWFRLSSVQQWRWRHLQYSHQKSVMSRSLGSHIQARRVRGSHTTTG